MNPQEIKEISTVWTHSTDILVERGEGCWFYDKEGNKYLDFTSGIGVTNTGHCHSKVVEAIKAQSEKLLFGQFNIVYHQPVIDLIEELKPVVPEGLDTFFFSSSGAEAVESSGKAGQTRDRPSERYCFQRQLSRANSSYYGNDDEQDHLP